MIRVLVVDDQKAIRQLLEDSFTNQKNIDLVGVADNGKLAIELIDKLRPDIVLLDFYMPIMDGLSVTRIVTKSYRKTKIIIFTAQNNEQLVAQTIMAGANGYLLKKSSLDNVDTALQTVFRGKYYLDPELANSNIFERQLPTIQGTSKLDNWTYWFAQEIITMWRGQTAEQTNSASSFVANIGLKLNRDSKAIAPIIFTLEKNSEHISFFKKLSLPLNSFQKDIWTKRDINCELMFSKLLAAEAEIKSWFENNLLVDEWSNIFEPESNIRSIRTNIFAEFDLNINTLWQNAGSQVILTWLEELDNICQTIRVNYDNQHHSYLQKETSAWIAFSILSNQLATSKKKTQKIENWLAVWKALLSAYKFQLYATLYSYASNQLVAELIRQIQAHKSIIVKTDNLLADLQSQFQQKTNISMTSILLLSNLVKLTKPMELRRKSELDLGLSLNDWGARLTTREIIKETIVAKVKPVANQLYIECCHRAISFMNDSKDHLN